MKTVELGDSGVEVSAACLGCMNFGTTTDEETSWKILDMYYEAGGRFLDTANCYARWNPGGKGGESEKLLGEWMKDRGNRDEMFIASKVGFEYPGVERGTPGWRIAEECDKSLKRLGIETLDLYYAHNDDRATPMEESAAAFDKLVKEGKVRHVGASNFQTWRLERALWTSRTKGWAQYRCLQQRFTYFRPRMGANFSPQTCPSYDIPACCADNNVRLIAYTPLLRGSYTRMDTDKPLPAQYVTPDNEARLTALREVAATRGATVNQIVLAWMMSSKPAVIPITAVSTTEQADENLAAVDMELTADEMKRLNEAGA